MCSIRVHYTQDFLSPISYSGGGASRSQADELQRLRGELAETVAAKEAAEAIVAAAARRAVEEEVAAQQVAYGRYDRPAHRSPQPGGAQSPSGGAEQGGDDQRRP